MSESNRFVAIDFETANNNRASACAVGWSTVEDGQHIPTKSGSTLIDPAIAPNEWLYSFHTEKHGIEPHHVQGAPSLAEAWVKISRVADGAPIVAHNAGFDLGVLRAGLQRAQVQPQPFRHTCTMALARRVWPSMPSYKLDYIARKLGIDLVHHEAGSDAQASAQVVLAAFDELGVTTLDDALQVARRQWGEFRSDLTLIGGGAIRLRSDDLFPVPDDADPGHPLFGKVVVITGSLGAMTKEEAAPLIARVGGQWKRNLTLEANVLVVTDVFSTSGKMTKALQWKAQGRDIELMDAQDFLQML